MLGKLFKHEMKACARLLLPIYLVLIIFTILDRIVINLDIFKGSMAIIPGLITTMYILSVIAIVVVSFVIIILRFYKNLITDEGYLMFTLPVKSHQLINSKLFAAIIWSFLSCIAALASVAIVVINPDRYRMFLDALHELYQLLHIHMGSHLTLLIVESIFLLIIATFQGILQIYASIAIGQLANGHKVLGSFGAYIGIYVGIQVIVTIIAAIGGMIQFRTQDYTFITSVFMPLILLFTTVLGAAFYFTAIFLFKKKLNLE